jgi:hypothetical protein
MLKRDAGPGRPKGSKNKLTRERVEKELRFLAFSDPVLLFAGVHGNRRSFTLREVQGMPEEIRRCIKKIKVRTENLTAGDGQQDITVEVDLWDKTKALELCARSLGMLKDVHVIEDLDQRKARLRAALAKREG